jgi:hypothetical protein
MTPDIHLEGSSRGRCFAFIPTKSSSEYIQKHWRHGNIKVTMDIYGHLFERDHRHFVGRLDDPQLNESATQPQPALEVTHAVSLISS